MTLDSVHQDKINEFRQTADRIDKRVDSVNDADLGLVMRAQSACLYLLAALVESQLVPGTSCSAKHDRIDAKLRDLQDRKPVITWPAALTISSSVIATCVTVLRLVGKL